MEYLKVASLGKAPALPANLRLGWKGLTGTNSLAYYEKARSLPQSVVPKSSFTLKGSGLTCKH
jgi:hypothetical protein